MNAATNLDPAKRYFVYFVDSDWYSGHSPAFSLEVALLNAERSGKRCRIDYGYIPDCSEPVAEWTPEGGRRML